MALNGATPSRGSAIATTSMRKRRTTSGGGTTGEAAGTILQFCTDDAPGFKISLNVALVMIIGFIAFLAVLHFMGKDEINWNQAKQDGLVGESMYVEEAAQRSLELTKEVAKQSSKIIVGSLELFDIVSGALKWSKEIVTKASEC